MHAKFRMRTGVAALAAAAILGSVAMSTGIAEAAPGDTPVPGLTLSPATGTSDSNFTLGLPALSSCPGDAIAGWGWTAFVAPSTADIGSLLISTSGLVQTPSGGNAALFRNLRIGASNITAQPPSSAPDNLLDPGVVSSVNLSGAVLIPGTYNLVVACRRTTASGTSAALQVAKHWAVPITVTASAGAGVNNYTYAFGAVPPPPALGAVTVAGTPGSQTLTVPVNAVTAIPAVTSYEVIATRRVGGAPVILPKAGPGAGQVVFTGLPAGVYDVQARALNSAGSGLLSAIPTAPADGSAGYVVASQAVSIPGAPAPVNGNIPVKVTVPTRVEASGFAPGAIVEIQIRSTPFTLATVTDGSLQDLDGAINGAVAASVTIPLLDPEGVPYIDGPHQFVFLGNDGVVASVNIQPGPSTLAGSLQQDVIVIVPAGQITFTQTCGKFGAITTESAAAGIPGFFGGWPAQAATTPATLPANRNGYADGLGRLTGKCNILMSTPTPVEDADPSVDGLYYQAVGSLNQVTVIDRRDSDDGWKVQGQMITDFTSPGDLTGFSSNYLGWKPSVTRTSPVTPEGYTQTVSAVGFVVAPGTGIANAGSGLKSAGRNLATTTTRSATQGGFGRADLDARMAMYIPVTDSKPGTYTATLELTLLPVS